MFTSVCVFISITLFFVVERQYRVISFIIFAEFTLQKIAYLIFSNLTEKEYVYFFGVKMPLILSGTELIIIYMLVQLLALGYLYKHHAHTAISMIVFSAAFYNFCLVLQYEQVTSIDFYGSYEFFMQPVMILELLYIFGLSKYVRNIRSELHLDIDSVDSARNFRRIRNGAVA